MSDSEPTACQECERKELMLRLLRDELERDLEVFEGDGYPMQAERVKEALGAVRE